jgi:hypothetical protein
MGGVFSAPKAPAPPVTPTVNDGQLQADAAAERKRRAGAQGRGATILSSGGMTDAATSTAKSTLLGG